MEHLARTTEGGTEETSAPITVSVIVPTLNEARNLPHAFAGLPDIVTEVIVVDGRSTDDTSEIAQILRADVRVIREQRKGKGAALQAGFDAARGDIIVMLDADGSADPREIEAFVKALRNGADFAKGSRFMPGGGSSDITFVRKLGNLLLCWIVNTLFRTKYTDLCYGYNAFWRRCLDQLDVNCDGFEVETLLNIRAVKAKLRIVEVPSFEHDRVYGESNLKAVRDGLRVVRTILSERFKRTKRRSAPTGYPRVDARTDKAQSTRICLVGPGTHMLSGITYYTYGLANELSSRHDVDVVFLRQLIPTRFYPGRERVGKSRTSLHLRDGIKSFDGIDWFWGRSMVSAVRFIRRQKPDVMVMQWWTGAVLHSYLALAILAKLMKLRLVIEVHESQDVDEAQKSIARMYTSRLAPRLFRAASTVMVHNQFDRQLVQDTLGVDASKLVDMPVSLYGVGAPETAPVARADDAPVELLHFGVIRSYKGLGDLLCAFDAIPNDQIHRFHLTIVGECWDGQESELALATTSRHRDSITVVNRYVDDAEMNSYFEKADVVVLPYRRSSTSGPLNIAMTFGKPVVVTRVGGLTEVAELYQGAVICEPNNPSDLLIAIEKSTALVGQHFAAPWGWSDSADRYALAFRGARLSSVTTPTDEELDRLTAEPAGDAHAPDAAARRPELIASAP